MSIITGIILTLLLLGIMVLNIFHVFIMPFHKWQLTQVTRETRLADSNHFLMLKMCDMTFTFEAQHFKFSVCAIISLILITVICLLFQLLFLHIYLWVLNMSTYDFILRKRESRKNTQTNTSTTAVGPIARVTDEVHFI
jgi:hypothetical protein